MVGITYSFPVSPQFPLDSFTPVLQLPQDWTQCSESPHACSTDAWRRGMHGQLPVCNWGQPSTVPWQVCSVRYWMLDPVGSWCANLCPMSVGLGSDPVFQEPVAPHSQNPRMSGAGGTPETTTYRQGTPPERRYLCPRSHSILGDTVSLPTPMPQPSPPCHIASPCPIDKGLSPSLFFSSLYFSYTFPLSSSPIQTLPYLSA